MMFTYNAHTVAIKRQNVNNLARQKFQIYHTDGTGMETQFSETESVVAYFTAISTPDVSPEFAELIYGLKEEYAWVLAELAKH